MKKILELRESVQRHGRQQRLSWTVNGAKTACCLRRILLPMRRWSRRLWIWGRRLSVWNGRRPLMRS